MAKIHRVLVAAAVAASIVGIYCIPQIRQAPHKPSPSDQPVIQEPVPDRPTELVALGNKIRAAVAKTAPTVVAVQTPSHPGLNEPSPRREFASGVIVSEDGLILSQYHVSHKGSGRDWGFVMPPGTKTTVLFADGTEAEAVLLGADVGRDLSMLRLTKPGKYPFAPLAELAVRTGDMVLHVGHPTGYVRGRPAPVRLGRVVLATDPLFIADCATEGGDSGGPYFDLDGLLVGIIRSGGGPPSVSAASVAIQRRGLIPFSATPAAVLRARWDDLRAGRIEDGVERQREESKRVDAAMAEAPVLPTELWSQGAKSLDAYRVLLVRGRRGVVEVLDGDERVALGTVVEHDLILTKASQLPDNPCCRLPGGTVAAANVIGIDPGYDLALLRIKAEGLEPVCWNDTDLSAGSLLVAPGPNGPVAAGIVSVAPRDTGAVAPKGLTRAGRAAAALPAILGNRVEGRGYWVEYVDGNAAIGVRPGDVITTLGGRPVRDYLDLAPAIEGRHAGERVTVSLLRNAKQVETTLTLTGPSPVLNVRAGGFTRVFEHDLPLVADECGGPVLGTDGRAVGVTLARSSTYGCQAVPVEVVRRLLPDLKTGKPLATLPTTPEPTPAPRPRRLTPVTLQEVRTRLNARVGDFRAVYVEYETTTEVVADPCLAASWGMNPLRHHKERNRYAFDGDKRMEESIRPGLVAYSVPLTEVTAAADAPPELVRQIKRQREAAESERLATGSPRWFFGDARSRHESRRVFDGKNASSRSNGGGPVMEETELFITYSDYLMNLGLSPIDRHCCEVVRRWQERTRFPSNFTDDSGTRLRPFMEPINGADCVVVEVTSAANPFDVPECDSVKTVPKAGALGVNQTLWLDPTLNFAPRRWEVRQGGGLVVRITNGRFEELGPGCWLPWEEVVEIGPPGWVPVNFRDQPVYQTTFRVTRIAVNQSKEEWFRQ